jgi:cell division protein FtsQ
MIGVASERLMAGRGAVGRSRAGCGELRAVAEQRSQQRARTSAAVIPIAARADRAAILRFLPSGRSLLVGFAIVAGAAGLYLLARATPMFSVQRIEVEGAPPAVAAHVRKALAPLEGTSLLALHGISVEQRLAPLTDVASVSYDRDFPHTIRVLVRPEEPAAIARRGAEAWLVSTSAEVISTVPAGKRRAYPAVWLTGSDVPEIGAAITDRFGLRAVRALALADRAHFKRRINVVRARDHDLTFLLASGIELRLGDLRAIRLKLAVADQILPKLRATGGYTYLDVSVPGRPVAGSNSQPEG